MIQATTARRLTSLVDSRRNNNDILLLLRRTLCSSILHRHPAWSCSVPFPAPSQTFIPSLPRHLRRRHGIPPIATRTTLSMATMTMDDEALEQRCVNTIRAVSADQPQAANSGHPGAPMGCAPMAHVLWSQIMTYSATDPAWINRDRFVLSNGHACALQYTMLHLAGYSSVTKQDLQAFRQLGSRTPGHPESFVTAGAYCHCCCYCC